MTYEETPVSSKPSTHSVNKVSEDMLKKFSSYRIMWHLVRRHKFGLLLSYAMILTVLYFAPDVPRLLLHMM